MNPKPTMTLKFVLTPSLNSPTQQTVNRFFEKEELEYVFLVGAKAV